jgi:hypothetical protein
MGPLLLLEMVQMVQRHFRNLGSPGLGASGMEKTSSNPSFSSGIEDGLPTFSADPSGDSANKAEQGRFIACLFGHWLNGIASARAFQSPSSKE